MAFSKDKAHDRAEKYAARGQHDRAAREYQTIVEHDPKDVRAWLMLADSLARTGDRAGAVSRYQQVGDFYASSREFQKALAVYRQVLNLDPSRLDIHYKCAQLNMEVGRVHDAIASFESIAQNQLHSGRVAEALETYRTIADADPTVVSKRLRLAELYSREKMLDPAVESFRLASQVLLDAGRHADYVRVAERLVYHKPGDRETVRELARVYLHLGDARRALMKLNGLLQADPGDAAGLELLAETFMALGKPDKASSVIGELVRKLREAGDDDGATRALDMGLDWIPNDADLLALRTAAPHSAAAAPAPGPTPTPRPTPTPVEPPDSDAIDLELDDSDVVELGEEDFVLSEDVAPAEDFSDGIELDFGGASNSAVLPAESMSEPEPARGGDASTSMTDHVLEEVSQSSARGQDLGAQGEAVDPSALTDSDKLLFEARVYVKYRLFDHALEHLDPLLADHPEHVPALSLRARSLTELERLEEAASMHARIAVLVEGGDPKLAREHVHAALAVSPRHPEALAVQSRLEGGMAEPAEHESILDFDADVADDALALELDDIAIDVAEPEVELELETSPIVVENRFGISEAGPLPEADSNAGIGLSIAPTEQMQALQRARSSGDTPPTAFIPRHPTIEMDAGPPEQSPTAVDIPGEASVGVPGDLGNSSGAIAELLDDEDSSLLNLEPEEETSFANLEPEPVPELEPEPELVPELSVDVDLSEELELSDDPDTPTPARAEAAEPDFDAEFDAAFEDGFDELLDVNAPDPVLTSPDPEPVASSAAAPPVAAVAAPAAPPAPPGGWPDLSDDLAEIRFYLDQGLDEDADFALTELAAVHPGHPEITKMQGEASGAQAPHVSGSAGAMPLIDLDGDDDSTGAQPDQSNQSDQADQADEDAYLSAIFGGGDKKSPKGAAKTSSSVGVSAKAQDVAGANARDRFDLGMAYREMGLIDSAVTEFEGACSDPQWESRARVMLGALRVLQGDIDAAVGDLQRASATASNDEEQSSAAYELAVLYEKTGDNAAAIGLLEGIAAGFRERDAKLSKLRG